MSERSDTSHGFGRVLVAVYAVFALAAAARSIYQLIAEVDADTVVPYVLSAFAGIVYVAATYALASNHRRLALVTIGIELVGVIAVGILSLVDGELFPDQTVWSDFGRGYLFIPLVLPFVGLWWLHHTRPDRDGDGEK
jgi:hypothetical protein